MKNKNNREQKPMKLKAKNKGEINKTKSQFFKQMDKT